MIVSLESVREAARGLEGVAVRTPLIAAPALARLAGESVALKAEHLQPVGAFKIRGAFTAISRLSAADRAAGVITYSSGNHGQAVAYAAARLGTHAIVVMPDHAPAIKIEGVKRHGGEVRMGGPTSATRREKAETIAQAEGLTIIPPFDDPNVIAGQATCSLEILEQAPDVETLIVPVGGGGLLAGACIAVAALKRPAARCPSSEPRVLQMASSPSQ
jgi:threonine dehydratase